MTVCPATAPIAETFSDVSVVTIGRPVTAGTGISPHKKAQAAQLYPRHRVYFPVEIPKHRRAGDWLFPLLLIAAVMVCIGAGLYARRIPPAARAIAQSVVKIRTEFQFTEPKRIAEPPPVLKKTEPKPEEPPVDLTEQKVVEHEETVTEETPPEQPKQQERKPVRKVFGLRKVYSTGLGSGGAMSDAVVGKIGNTINKEYDTITATESDIKGIVVSTATVTTAPRFRKVVKPNYTKEMVDRKVQGTVKVKVLVDIDGRVKKATCINDIGFDSAAQAVKATMAMEFDPAMRGSDPVAVWIIVPIRFMLLG